MVCHILVGHIGDAGKYRCTSFYSSGSNVNGICFILCILCACIEGADCIRRILGIVGSLLAGQRMAVCVNGDCADCDFAGVRGCSRGDFHLAGSCVSGDCHLAVSINHSLAEIAAVPLNRLAPAVFHIHCRCELHCAAARQGGTALVQCNTIDRRGHIQGQRRNGLLPFQDREIITGANFPNILAPAEGILIKVKESQLNRSRICTLRLVSGKLLSGRRNDAIAVTLDCSVKAVVVAGDTAAARRENTRGAPHFREDADAAADVCRVAGNACATEGCTGCIAVFDRAAGAAGDAAAGACGHSGHIGNSVAVLNGGTALTAADQPAEEAVVMAALECHASVAAGNGHVGVLRLADQTADIHVRLTGRCNRTGHIAVFNG